MKLTDKLTNVFVHVLFMLSHKLNDYDAGDTVDGKREYQWKLNRVKW